MDSISTRLQMIALWHDAASSTTAITGLTTAFLIISYFKPRFYATVMILLFCYHFLKYWFGHVWPVIRVPPREDHDCDQWTHLHPQILTLAEIKLLAQRVETEFRQKCQHLLQLRQDSPFRFCAGISCILLITAILGMYVKGLLLLYLSSLSLMIIPGLYTYVLPDNVKSFLKSQSSLPSNSPSSESLSSASSLSSSSSSNDADEYEIITEHDLPPLDGSTETEKLFSVSTSRHKSRQSEESS